MSKVSKILTFPIGVLIAAGLCLGGFTLSAFADEKGSYSIEYQGEASGMVSADSDLFAHFGTLMPGDTVTGVVAIDNKSNETQEFLFYAKPDETAPNSEAADELLDEMELAVFSDTTGETVYEGALRVDALADAVSLGTFAPGEGEKLSFLVHMPAELGNEYALAENEVTWVFATTEVATEQTGNAAGRFEKTGDDPVSRMVIGMVCGCLIASCIIALGLRKKRRKQP